MAHLRITRQDQFRAKITSNNKSVDSKMVDSSFIIELLPLH